jgi:hypothetical protein
MSTTMTSFAAGQKGGTIDVGRAGNRCVACQAELSPGDPLMAALRETPDGFDRVDVCPACWPAFDRAGVLAFWRTAVRRSDAKPKRFVDDEVLCEIFERLADAPEPAKVNFRFVLGLILMRKRLLAYEASRHMDDGRDVWVVRRRGRPDRMDLVNPHLDEQQVAEVSRQMGDILNETL